jgi:hypothetical protein
MCGCRLAGSVRPTCDDAIPSSKGLDEKPKILESLAKQLDTVLECLTRFEYLPIPMPRLHRLLLPQIPASHPRSSLPPPLDFPKIPDP